MMKGKRLYWRPSHVPIPIMAGLAILALASVAVTEIYKGEDESAAFYDVMLQASQTVEDGMAHLKPIRGRIEPIDPEIDLRRTGMIGVATSIVTSNSGSLEAKDTAVNPNWAAVAVKLLVDAGVREGDVVAVAVSGSFPVINFAAYAAIEALGAEPIIVASVSASQWGANVPDFLWIDMARELRNAGYIEAKAVAATLGGREDRALGFSKEGLASLRRSITRADIPLLDIRNYRQSVSRRIALYNETAGDRPIRAFLNVGGGTASAGPPSIDHLFESGLSRAAPQRAFTAPSVIGYFLEEGVPVIHFSGVEPLAARHGLPVRPEITPSVGEGGVYQARDYRRWLAVVCILLLLGATTVALRSPDLALAFDDTGKRKAGGMRPKV